MTQANQADLFGEGVYGTQQAPTNDPYTEMLRRRQAQARAQQQNAQAAQLAAQGRVNTGYVAGGPGGRSVSQTIQGPNNPMNIPSNVWGDAAQIGGYLGTLGPARDLAAEYGGPLAPLAAFGPIGAAGVATDLVSPGRSGAPTVQGIPGVPGGLSITSPTYGPRAVPTGAVGGGGGGRGGGGAISAEAQRVIDQAQQFGQQNTAMGQQYAAQAQQYAGRAAPQITAPSSAQADAVYNAAMGFRGNDSGAAGIRAATADVSGAGRLEAFQADMQGINNLEAFQSTNSQQGVNALYGYNPDATYLSANQLGNFFAENTAAGANAVAGFNPDMVQADAESLRRFQADRTGIDRLNAFADEVQGPSQAQAFLRAQSDADKRAMLAIARSGRGSPADAVRAQRQAITEGSAIAAETRGQGAILAAQEYDTYKQRQLAALAQAGSLISQSEAQRLTALSNAGALMSQADQQKLAALTAYGQLKATQDAQQLSARQAAGQLNLGADTARLSATQSAASLQGQMDAQRLAAISNAAQARTDKDRILSTNLANAGQIRLQGSEINQRGQIAATQAELQASAQNLQALSLAGNISTTIRGQDISVLQSNLSSSLQTMGMNDNQVRFFSQMQQDRDFQSQNIAQQAGALGINAQVAQDASNLAWDQFAYSQLSDQQRLQYNYDVLNSGNARADRQQIIGGLGTLLSAGSSLFGGSGGGGGGSAGAPAYQAPLPQVPNYQLQMPAFNPYTPQSFNPSPIGGLQLTQPQIGQNVGYQPTAPSLGIPPLSYTQPTTIDY